MTSLRQNVAEPRAALQLSIWEKGERSRARFVEHRRAHPAVYRRLVELAREAKARGWTKVGIGFLWERLRWEFGPHGKDVYGFGCNNDLRSHYARAIAAENDDLRDLFEFRALRSE